MGNEPFDLGQFRGEGGLDRRSFLVRGAGTVAAFSAIGPILAACGGGDDGGSSGSLPLARPDNPVELPLYSDNPAIEAGLKPEAGPLKLYAFAESFDPSTIKSFEEQYGVEVQYTTYSSAEEGIAKIVSGGADFDLTMVTPPDLARLVVGKQVRPLTLDYIPNREGLWDFFKDPYWDQGTRYSLPYDAFAYGLDYRKDLVEDPAKLENPYDAMFNPEYAGKNALVDEMRVTLAYPMLRDAYPDGSPDVNTGDSSTIDGARDTLSAAVKDAGLQIDTFAYTQLGDGTYVISHGFSADVFFLPYLWPKSGDFAKEWGQWMPERPQVNSDLWLVLSAGKSPVLAHLFINHMLSDESGLANTGYGLQAPLKSITPQLLVKEQFVPAELEGQVLTEDAWTNGYVSLTLSPADQKLWTRAWAEVKAG